MGQASSDLSAESELRQHLSDKANEITDELRKAAVEHMRKRLKDLSVNTDVMSDDEVVKRWKEYLAENSLWKEDEKEVDKIMTIDKKEGDDEILKLCEAGERLKEIGIKYARERLKEVGINTDGMSDTEVANAWAEYEAKHPLSQEDKKELDKIMEGFGV